MTPLEVVALMISLIIGALIVGFILGLAFGWWMAIQVHDPDAIKIKRERRHFGLLDRASKARRISDEVEAQRR